jgi:PAS domain S-box-containing protein
MSSATISKLTHSLRASEAARAQLQARLTALEALTGALDPPAKTPPGVPRLPGESPNELPTDTTRQQFWDLSLDLMIVVDGHRGYIVDANPAWTATFGWTWEEVTSVPFLDFLHPDDRDRTDDVRQELLDGLLLLHFENRYRIKGGGYRDLEWKARQDSQFIYAYARDITEQREAALAHQAANEALTQQAAQQRAFLDSQARAAELSARADELMAQQERFMALNLELQAQAVILQRQKDLTRRIIDHAPAAMGFLSPELVYEWVNPRHAEYVGISIEQTLGKGLVEVYGEASAALVAPMLQAVLDTGVPHTQLGMEFRYLLDGVDRVTHWDFTCQPIVTDDRTLGILVLGHEVSPRVEKERLQTEKIAALEHANVFKEQFLGILSHELRTPLNAIQGFGSVLEDGLAGPLTSLQTSYIQKILLASDNMLVLVDDLLEMSRLAAGNISFELEPTDFQAVTDAAWVLLAPRAAAKGQSLVVELPASLPLLLANAQRLAQVIDNVAGNAIKYTPNGGTITLKANQSNGFVRIEVHDTGIGIPAHQLTLIFEAFTQVDMTNTRAKGGVGLGLSIVRALVEAHGGTVGVESTEGQGSTFWFTIPTVAE